MIVPIALPSLSTSDQVPARHKRCSGYSNVYVPLAIAGTIDLLMCSQTEVLGQQQQREAAVSCERHAHPALVVAPLWLLYHTGSQLSPATYCMSLRYFC